MPHRVGKGELCPAGVGGSMPCRVREGETCIG